MKLNWFSPLPPAKTGIARYTADLLPALTARAEVTLWTEQDEWDASLNDLAPVRHYDPDRMCWRDVNDADLSIYHIGNNHHFHLAPWQVSRWHPGLVVLHDLHLHHFFAGVFHAHLHDREAYLAQMQSYYGEQGRQDGEAFWSGKLDGDEMAQRYTLHRLVTDEALGVLVHTAGAFAAFGAKDDPPVIHAPLPYVPAPRNLSRRTTNRDRHSKRRLIVFGYLGSNRRLETVLKALAAMPDRDRFRLDICGEIWNEQSVREQVQSAGIENLVRLRGYVPDAELTKALNQVDLAINLRNPTMGEASLSQLQIWDHALPSLVTRLGWYATLPADTVAFVRPDRETSDITLHLRRFLADSSSFAEMGRKGRLFLEDVHSCDAYVDKLLNFAQQAPAARRRHLALKLAARAGESIAAWCPPSLTEPTLRRVAVEIRNLLLTPEEAICRRAC
jgi:glycosyltransferase involved in cell wall biosynthesis